MAWEKIYDGIMKRVRVKVNLNIFQFFFNQKLFSSSLASSLMFKILDFIILTQRNNLLKKRVQDDQDGHLVAVRTDKSQEEYERAGKVHTAKVN